MEWGRYVPSMNHLLFLLNVCTAFDNKIVWARSFWESPNNKVLISLRKLCWCKKMAENWFKSVRNNCSSLKYDLFRCNIIKDWRCICGYIREDSSHFLLNCHLYIEQRTVLFHFLHQHNFYCQIYTIGLNTSFTTYMKFSPVPYKHRSNREHDG
jgi:hypothetical protein